MGPKEGTEDLGNGYSVGFLFGKWLYHGQWCFRRKRVKLFSKQATLSLSGNFGELAFGRMGGLASYEGSYSIWDASPFGTDYLRPGWEIHLSLVRLTITASFTFLLNLAV